MNLVISYCDPSSMLHLFAPVLVIALLTKSLETWIKKSSHKLSIFRVEFFPVNRDFQPTIHALDLMEVVRLKSVNTNHYRLTLIFVYGTYILLGYVNITGSGYLGHLSTEAGPASFFLWLRPM